MARPRETSHPADAVRIYRGQVAALLQDTGQQVYEEAVRHLEATRGLLRRSGREADFHSLIAEIRATQRRKRNLMKLLDQKGW